MGGDTFDSVLLSFHITKAYMAHPNNNPPPPLSLSDVLVHAMAKTTFPWTVL